MAIAGRYTKILLDEFDFSGTANSVNVSATVPVLDTTGFQVAAMTSLPGLPSGGISFNGYYNGSDAGELETVLQARIATDGADIITALFGTASTGCPAYTLFSTYPAEMNIDMPVADLLTMSSTFPNDGRMVRGLRLYEGTVSGTGTQSSVDFGSSTSNGGRAFLHVQSITGTATNATIDVESSSTEGGSYASEGTFTFSSVTGYTISLSGTVNRWLRINTTSLGGATDFTVVVTAGLVGVTY